VRTLGIRPHPAPASGRQRANVLRAAPMVTNDYETIPNYLGTGGGRRSASGVIRSLTKKQARNQKGGGCAAQHSSGATTLVRRGKAGRGQILDVTLLRIT